MTLMGFLHRVAANGTTTMTGLALCCSACMLLLRRRTIKPARNSPSATCRSNVPLVSSSGRYKHMLQMSLDSMAAWFLACAASNHCCKHANHSLPADKDLLVETCLSHTTAAGVAPGAVAVAVTNLLSFLQKDSSIMLRADPMPC